MSTVEQIIAKPDTVEEAVSFGVAILDEHIPGWAEKADAESLIMSDATFCVLGQLFNSYDQGCELLGLYEGTAERCGFNVTGQKPWKPLEAEWMRVIEERQEAAS